MKCPKCNSAIDDKMLVCPECKKVLKLLCPKCNTINEGNRCKKCGFTIIARCHQCGKINQTIASKCQKCGFSTYKSVAISASNTDEFAAMLIKFPNLPLIKQSLGSTKLYEKFKFKLERMVLEFANSNGLLREVIENFYVLKFNKDYSFSDSANSAIAGAIEFLNSVTELNFKLSEMKDVVLECNISILKRDIESQPDDFEAGFDIKLFYDAKKTAKLTNCLQVIVDSDIYSCVCEKYSLSSLSSSFVKNRVVMLFELEVKKYVKIPKKPEGVPISELPSLPVFEQEVEPVQENLYSSDLIDFEELRFDFLDIKSIDVINSIKNKLSSNNVNLISVRASTQFQPDSWDLLKAVEAMKKFQNIIEISCSDLMKYGPYSFIKEFAQVAFDFARLPKNYCTNDFSQVSTIDERECIKSLVSSHLQEEISPDEFRGQLFDNFYNLFSAISGSLIVVHDFDKIDDSSFELVQVFFEQLEEFNVSYILTVDKDYSLNKKCHFLLSSPYYTEMLVDKTSFKELIERNKPKYEQILESYYLDKIGKNFKGSVLYVNHAINLLVANEALAYDGKSLCIANPKNVFLPLGLGDLISKEISYLASEPDAYKLMVTLLLIGPSVDLKSLLVLGFENLKANISFLKERKLIVHKENLIYVRNYNLCKDNFITQTNLDFIKQSAQNLLDKGFNSEMSSVQEAFIYSVLEMESEENTCWQNLAILNNLMGDYSAYINCVIKVLNLDGKKQISLEQEYVSEIYSNISSLLHRCPPDKIHDIVQVVLANLERANDNKRIVDICYKMLQGYLYTGNYQQALESIRKISAEFPYLSFDPRSEDFNLAYFYISLMKIEILFSLGNLRDCADEAQELISVLSKENILNIMPQSLEIEAFEDLIFDSLAFAVLAKVSMLDLDINQFLEKIYAHIGGVPHYFQLFIFLQDILMGYSIEQLPEHLQVEDNRFSKTFVNLIEAFNNVDGDYKKFASAVHRAKIAAKANRLYQIELICDLIIGYSYFKLEKSKKAMIIYNNVLDTSTKNGMKSIAKLVWYLIAMLKFAEGNYEVAAGMANNAIIQIERDTNSSDLLLFFLKRLIAEVYHAKGEEEPATLCLNNATFIKEKYNLNYDVFLPSEMVETLQSPVKNYETVSTEDNIGEN